MTPEQIAAAFTAAGFTDEPSLVAVLRLMGAQAQILTLTYQAQAVQTQKAAADAAADAQAAQIAQQIAALEAQLAGGGH